MLACLVQKITNCPTFLEKNHICKAAFKSVSRGRWIQGYRRDFFAADGRLVQETFKSYKYR